MKRRIVTILLATAVLMLITAGAAVYGFFSYVSRPLPIAGNQLIEIPPGSSLNRVAASLNAQGVLTFPAGFIIWARLQKQERALKPGEYELQPGMTPESLLALLVSGRNKQYPLTLVEGWTFRQSLEAIWQHEKIENSLLDSSDEQILAALVIDDPELGSIPFLEGALFPETYYYTAGTSDLEILRRAHQTLLQVLKQEWEVRLGALPYDSPWQALVLASIIEKESGLSAEKQEIAGVFTRRLERNMRLQSDPTVIYGMGAAYDGNIRRADLQATTAWNTYRINGLPPTPIALAGRDSIHASLNPGTGNSLYFVADGSGGHVFSEDLDAHNRAVQRYLNLNRQTEVENSNAPAPQ